MPEEANKKNSIDLDLRFKNFVRQMNKGTISNIPPPVLNGMKEMYFGGFSEAVGYMVNELGKERLSDEDFSQALEDIKNQIEQFVWKLDNRQN